jgi:hypothetical protein
MISREDIESFLIRSDMDIEEIEEGLWIVHSSADQAEPPIAVSYSPPLLVMRSRLMTAPADEKGQLETFRRLLQMNATELIHGSYGLEDGEVILTDALELENLDYSEFLASLESLSLAVSSYRHVLQTD